MKLTPILKRTGWLGVVLLLSACSKPARDVFPEAEALEAQGKAEEAARLFDLACSYAPEGEKCAASDRRAAEARIKGAEAQMAAGSFVAASRLLVAALATADAATAQKASEKLASEDLKQGIAYERALALGKTEEARRAMEAVAATKTAATDRARAWLDKERPAIVLRTVKAACGPTHEGSCSKVTAELRTAVLAGPEGEEAGALVDAEERRVYPLRVNAEAFLQNMAAVAEHDALMEGCKFPADIQGSGSNIPGTMRYKCHQFCGCTSYMPSAEDVEGQIQKRRSNDVLWRRTMKSIGDPELIAALKERKKKAQAPEGGGVERLVIPKPRPAPKAVGAQK